MRRTLLAGGIGLAGLTVLLMAATAAGAATFSNPTPITISAGNSSPASPYPSPVAVTGIDKPITDVNVRLNGFSHTNPSDIGVVLAGPTGSAIDVLDCAVGSTDAVALNVTFDDSAPASAPNNGALASTSYKPTNYCPTLSMFTAPGPGTAYSNPGPTLGGTATLASTFGGTSANGTWNLFVLDFANANGGQIAAGWTLEIQPDPSPVTNPPVTPVTTPTKKTCKKPKKKGSKSAAAAKKKRCKKKKKK